MIKRIFYILIGVISSSSSAQNRWDTSLIPDSLQENAYSVVRKYFTEFTYLSAEYGEESRISVVTVLNSKGETAGWFNCHCDKFKELKSFSGEIYNSEGKLLRKIKKSELQFSDYNEGLVSDDYLYYWGTNTLSYPYTVKYEWKVKNKNGIIGFPVFMPQYQYNQSVQEAVYRINLPSDTAFNYHGFRMENLPVQEIKNKNTIYQWSVHNLAALEKEDLGPPLYDMVPYLLAVPVYFSYEGSQGNLNDWRTFGLWQYNLLKGRNNLPEPFVAQLREMTREARTDKEKVKIVYDYLAGNTRYVSIQLGIGGLQPIAADEVCRLGFGDCKGLSNYLKAMLEALDIPAFYTIIHTERTNLLKEFTSANQFDHVILQVPLPGDTLWLECTNANLPLGYIHENIAGHEALLVKPEGGIICRLPSYTDSLNRETCSVHVVLKEKSTVDVHVEQCGEVGEYEKLFFFASLNLLKQKEFLRQQIYLPQTRINSVKLTENKTSHPSITLHYDFQSEFYGNRTGNRLFIPVNILRSIRKWNNPKRIYNLYIDKGYLHSDTIRIQLPTGYQVESETETINLNHSFGYFRTYFSQDANEITVIQTLFIKSGQYTPDVYPIFEKFCNTVSKCYDSKLVLRKRKT